MKKKIIISIVILTILILIIKIMNQKNVDYAKNNEVNIIEDSTVEQSNANVIEVLSESDNHIVKEEIETTGVKVIYEGNSVSIETTLKNISEETLKGFFIDLDLLDEKNNVIMKTTDNVQETIKPGETYILKTYGIDIPKIDTIKKVKINSFSKSS